MRRFSKEGMKKFDAGMFSLFLGVIILTTKPGYPQNSPGFNYVNPVPNSNYVSIYSTVIIRQGDEIDKSSINSDLIELVGSKSGLHNGRLILAEDSRTLIFRPAVPFQTGEDVTVKLNDGLMTENGVDAGPLKFKFHTSLNANQRDNGTEQNTYKSQNNGTSNITRIISSTAQAPDTSLPTGLPLIIIDKSNNPAPGYFFLPASPYLEIVDNEGTPVFYWNVGGSIYDFDLQTNGELTYFIYPVDCNGLDSSYNLIQTFNTADSFSVDVHDLRVLPDGSYYIFGKRVVTMDLSQYGGSTSAQVIDGALQEFDSEGNLIFEWDALAHYKITDVDELDVNTQLNQSVIDFSHFNSVAFDSDSTILISARDLDEITKINRNTGDIIWRFSGKNNQFTFINDTIGFSRQHDVRHFSNGDISIFDNGTFHPVQISSAVEYKLDEVNKTATLVRRIYHNNIFTDTEGSVQELSNGNRVISWGHNWDPVVTEIMPNDSIATDLSYQYFIDNYRAFKYNWRTNLFSTNTDSLDYGNVSVGDSLDKIFTIYNPHDSSVTINEFYCSDSSFTTKVNLPVSIQPHDSLVVPVIFKPKRNETYEVTLNIRNFGQYQGQSRMIARQVILSGTAGNISTINSKKILSNQFALFQNYPNPFNPSTFINYEVPKYSFVTLKVFDILGREIVTLVNEEKPAGKYTVTFDATNLSSGIYLYRITAGIFSNVKKMLLIK
jgi:Arylsulfotransferase (ASST)/Secretion system C-terminal sorting domain/Cep192 domain 4